MLSSEPRLQRQKSNLVKFTNDNASRLGRMIYNVWTERTTHHVEPVRFGPSRLLPGTVGVFPAHGSTCAPGSVMALYPGVLMWQELHNEFSKLYHCPTAVALGVLDYTVSDPSTAVAMQLEVSTAKGWTVRMVLVGDPTCAGSIFNSPRGLEVQPNCSIQSCRPADINRYKQIKKGDARITVDASVLAVHRDERPLSDLQAELMFCYDSHDAASKVIVSKRVRRQRETGGSDVDDNFWKAIVDDGEFCEFCFSREAAPPDMFMMCSHASKEGGKSVFSCSAIRHQSCFLHILLQHERWLCLPHSLDQPIDAPVIDMTLLLGAPSPQRHPVPAVHHHDSLDVLLDGPSPLRLTTHPIARMAARPPIAPGVAGSHGESFNRFERGSSIPDYVLEQATPPYIPPSLLTPPPRRVAPLSLGTRLTQSAAPNVSTRFPSLAAVQPRASLFSATRAELNESKGSEEYASEEQYEPIPTDQLRDSDVGSSDGESTDSGSSDTESNQQPTCAQQLAQRTTSFVPVSVLSAKKRPVGDTSVALQESGKLLLRGVWLEFCQDLDKAKRGHRLTWILRPSDKPEKERNSFDKLLRQFNHITACCATEENRRRYPAAAGSMSFKNVVEFLKAQLETNRSAQFDKKTLNAQMRAIQQSPAPWHWHGFPLCGTCFTQAHNVGRTKFFDVRQREHKHTKKPKGLKTRMVKKLLMQKATGECQFLPNKMQVKGANGVMLEVRVLPYRSVPACIEALQILANQVRPHENMPVLQIRRTTFQRAVKLIAREEHISLNLKACKSLAACSICTELQGTISKARTAFKDCTFFSRQLSDELSAAWVAFDGHTEEWKEQREYFGDKKNIALCRPWMLWVITYDGMDTNKTQLPHTVRQEKEMFQLPLRVVGAFCYGAPIPCIGLLSFDDVPTKGGSASVTCVERMLDMQFQAMDPARIDPIPGDEAFNERLKRPADPNAMDIDEPECVEPPPPPEWVNSAGESKPTVPFSWPEVCHFTFDNTASDNKNAHTFRFFALLVLEGVFMAVTVSCLMVGHTHDIVDQMFSVWSSQLRINDVYTLSKMIKLFRENYGSKIYELKELLDRMAASEAAAGNDQQAVPEVAERLRNIAKELGVKPEVVLQEMVVDADAWCYTSIGGITIPHVFRLVKETIDDPLDTSDSQPKRQIEAVAMYCRYLARSYEDPTVYHNPKWRNTPGGPWSSRVVIMHRRDALDPLRGKDEKGKPLDSQCQPLGDPYRYPPRKIDDQVIEGVKSYIETLKKGPSFEAADGDEWESLFAKFENSSADLQAKCATCAEFMNKLTSIGTIRRPINPSPEQKAHADKQTADKKAATEGLRKHRLDEPDKHEESHARGWWAKWITRVKEVIRPYYILRGFINPHYVSLQFDLSNRAGRLLHPASLPSSRSDPPLTHSRVDQTTLATKGLPKIGQWALVRGTTVGAPIWVGMIVAEPKQSAKSRQSAKQTQVELEEESSSHDDSSDGDLEHVASSAAASASAASASASTGASRRAPAPRRAAAVASYTEPVDPDDLPLTQLATRQQALTSSKSSKSSRHRSARCNKTRSTKTASSGSDDSEYSADEAMIPSDGAASASASASSFSAATYQTVAEAAVAARCRAAATTNLPEPTVSRHDESGKIDCGLQRCTHVEGLRNRKVQCILLTNHGQFCPAHLDSEMGLRIGASNVPNAGLGLHATRDFAAGAHVSPLTGNLLLNSDGSRKEWLPLSGYVGSISGKAAIDAAPTNAAPARLINASTGTGTPSNCKLVPYSASQTIRVETTRAVAAGQEFLTAYSAGYWRKKTPPASAASKLMGFEENVNYLKFLEKHPALCRSPILEVRAVRDLSEWCFRETPGVICQLGVFATEAIDVDVELCLYSACWRDPTPADRERQTTHLKRIANSSSILDGEVTAALFKRYTLATHSLDAICALPAADFEPTGLSPAQLERFKTVMPIGCMVNTVRKRVDSKGEALVANCAWIDMGVKQDVQFGKMEVLKATRPIGPGDELLVQSYKNKDQQREFVGGTTAASTSAASASAASASAASASAASGSAASASRKRGISEVPTASMVRPGRPTHKHTTEVEDATFHIKYYSHQSNPLLTRLKLLDMEHWQVVMRAEGPEALAEWDNAVASFARKEYTRLPVAALQRFKDIVYIMPPRCSVDTVQQRQMYWWGEKSQVLTRENRLAATAWNKAVEDLCEVKDSQHCMSIEHDKDWEA